MIKPFSVSSFIMNSRFGGTKVVPAEKINEETTKDRLSFSSVELSVLQSSMDIPDGNGKPSFDEMIAHLEAVSPFPVGSVEAADHRRRYINSWNRCLEENLREIEQGDKDGEKIYYYVLDPNDAVCRKYLLHKTYVTREQLLAYPEIIPPFHLGCMSRLKRALCAKGNQPESSLRPLFITNELPMLPDWWERSDVLKSCIGDTMS
jgi:hypothetical protein